MFWTATRKWGLFIVLPTSLFFGGFSLAYLTQPNGKVQVWKEEDKRNVDGTKAHFLCWRGKDGIKDRIKVYEGPP